MPKCDDDLKVHLSSALKAQIKDLARRNDRDTSDYVRYILTRHVIVEAALAKAEGAQGMN